MLLLLVAVLALLLGGALLPGKILFSNDGPLGELVAQCHRLPARFTGCWDDLNLLGSRDWGASPSITFGLLWLLKPVWFAKLYAPLGLLILGFGAWCFFRQSGLVPAACILGGLAAALNSAFFSTACWGMAAHPITVGMSFFALAALADVSTKGRWLRTILAGLAVGMGVMESADVGVIFSLFVAAFVLYQAWTAAASRGKNLVEGIGRVALMALCAATIAAQAISGLVATEIKGIAGTQQDVRSKQEHWDWATEWSLPKVETLSVVVPGLFGYRMDTPDGGEYWGAIGRAAAWDRYFADGRQGPPPEGLLRYSGGGIYAGTLVMLLVVWAAWQSLRRGDSAFSLAQRKTLWFWLGVGLVSLLLAYGRFAPFYRIIYLLPYFSTIRNPVKFLHLVSFAVVVLFAWGVDGLWRCYIQPAALGAVPGRAALPRGVPGKGALPGSKAAPGWAGPKGWWAKAGRTEKNWTRGCFLVLGVSLLAWLAYASSRSALEQYLQGVQFDEAQAQAIAGFSIAQVGWFVLFLVLAGTVMFLIQSGAFGGRRAWRAGLLLGVVLVVDLGRANEPWIIYWNYNEKYADNPIIDALRARPYEGRVSTLPFAVPRELSLLNRLYQGEWLKHQFPCYNVQSLDAVQMPRMPADLAAYENALSTTNRADFLRCILRAWQLTNTRYLLGPAGFNASLNRQTDPAHPEFRIAESFSIVPKPGITHTVSLEELTAVPTADGPFALIEFTGALPRAKLYSNWQVLTNDQAVLSQLGEPSFDPEQTVFVAGGAPAVPLASSTRGSKGTGTVEFVSYAPKAIKLRSDAPGPSVLLLNDRFDPNWHVRVDGTPERLLRCNYIMRGVYLTPGTHSVEFRFQPPLQPLYVSLAAIGVGLLLLGFVVAMERRAECPVPAPASTPLRPGYKAATAVSPNKV